jgi:hypothetical protein
MARKLSARDRVNKTLRPKKGVKKGEGGPSRGKAQPTAKTTPRKAQANTLGRTAADTEFSQDHLSAAAKFVRSVGGVEQARALIDSFSSQNSSNPRQREGM